jgi:hypothetical protein
MRAGDTNEAIQMLDLLLEFLADGALPNRRPRYLRRKHHVSRAPRAG